MLIEMHCHTAEHSACSSVPAVELLRRVLARRIVIRTITNMKKWKSAERAETIMAAVADHQFNAGRFRVPLPIGIDAEQMTLIEQGVRGKPVACVVEAERALLQYERCQS